MPLYPFIVLRAKECAPTPCPSVVFSLGFTFEPLKELGVRQLYLEVHVLLAKKKCKMYF
jgi:hypothetical protein